MLGRSSGSLRRPTITAGCRRHLMQPHLLRTPDAARYVGLAESTLEKMRIYGTGPVYQKAGPKIVVYRAEDLDAWLARGRRTSTSQLANADILPKLDTVCLGASSRAARE